jgi:cell division septum initiation protein DivIVA
MGAAIIVAAVLAGAGSPVHAQSDVDEQIQALQRALDQIRASTEAGDDVEARLQALQDEITKLQQQIAEGQAGKASPGEGTTIDSATTSQQATISAQTSEDALPPPGVQGSPNPLRDELTPLTGKDLLDESFPNSIPIPGSKIRFRIGGYAKLDLIQDLDYVGDRYEFELATIPVEGTPEYELGGRTTLHAKETRINFDLRSVAKNEKHGWEFPLQVFVEFDFFDDRATFALQPRLRHAYGVIGRFLAGQTWSVTTDVSALAGTIDFSGGDSLYGGRVAQARWADRISDTVTWAVGVEDPVQSIGNPLGLEGQNRASLPTLAGKLRWESTGGSHVQLGADVFQLEWQGGESGPSDEEIGYGLSLSGRFLVGKNGNDALVATATIGSGAAHRVVSLSFDGGNDAVITSDGLDVMSHRQVYGGYSHYWTKSLNSTISAAWAELDNSEFQPGDAIHKAGSLHVNLIWFPYKLVSTGIEYMYGLRENKDGAKGTASRIQMMAKFKFN